MKFVDDLVYEKTGQRLNTLQRGIIEGTLKQKQYSEIAESHGLSADHVKDVGYELLQKLSEVFDEPVDKKNLKAVLERQGNFTISDCSFGDNNIVGYINIFSDRPNITPDKIESIIKLRQFGLSDNKIAEALGLTLEQVKQVKTSE